MSQFIIFTVIKSLTDIYFKKRNSEYYASQSLNLVGTKIKFVLFLRTLELTSIYKAVKIIGSMEISANTTCIILWIASERHRYYILERL